MDERTTRSTQLSLIEGADRADWRLDDETRERGRRGIQGAREALRHAMRQTAA